MKRKTRVAALAFFLAALGVFQALAQDSRQEAMDLLAEAQAEECRICVEKLQAKAFRILDQVYFPGLEIASDASCLFEKSGQENQLILVCKGQAAGNPAHPRVTFLLHAPGAHLVGVSPQDYTSEALAGIIRHAPERTRFAGRILVVGYPYGDGRGFNYYPSSRHLQVHCRIEEIRALTD